MAEENVNKFAEPRQAYKTSIEGRKRTKKKEKSIEGKNFSSPFQEKFFYFTGLSHLVTLTSNG